MKTLETLEKGGKNPGKFRYGYGLCAARLLRLAALGMRPCESARGGRAEGRASRTGREPTVTVP